MTPAREAPEEPAAGQRRAGAERPGHSAVRVCAHRLTGDGSSLAFQPEWLEDSAALPPKGLDSDSPFPSDGIKFRDGIVTSP